MSDRVQVSNLILAKLGERDRLLDPQDDTKAAKAINQAWDLTRDALLRRHLFNFAMRRTILTAQAGFAAIGRWTHSFPLPTDCLRVVEVGLSGQVIVDYQIEGRAIIAPMAGPLLLRWIARVVNVAEWDPLFVEAFASRMAYQLADSITGDLQRKSEALQSFNMAIREATGVDGRENPPEEEIESSWVTARYNPETAQGGGGGW
jgi:hypothetical protein